MSKVWDEIRDLRIEQERNDALIEGGKPFASRLVESVTLCNVYKLLAEDFDNE